MKSFFEIFFIKRQSPRKALCSVKHFNIWMLSESFERIVSLIYRLRKTKSSYLIFLRPVIRLIVLRSLRARGWISFLILSIFCKRSTEFFATLSCYWSIYISKKFKNFAFLAKSLLRASISVNGYKLDIQL
jgi:hypothetical protein